MYTNNSRFGDARSKQSKIQKHRQSEPGSGRRRLDPSIHATSRPWHTSTPGIRMNITTLGQIASRNPVAAKYLNKMNLSEQAQKKRGIAEREQGRGYDKMGLAMKRGLNHSVAVRKKYGAPNQDTIDRWQADLTGRAREMEKRGAPAGLSVLQQGLMGGGEPQSVAGRVRKKAAERQQAKISLYDRQVAAISGMRKRLPKRQYHTSGINAFQYQY